MTPMKNSSIEAGHLIIKELVREVLEETAAARDAQTEKIVQEAVAGAVEQVFRGVGVEVGTADGRDRWRANLAHLERKRKLDEQIGGKAIMGVVGIVVSGVALLIWQGFTHLIAK